MARLPHNVCVSAYRKGMYRAYDGRGYVWLIEKHNIGWYAKPAPNNPARYQSARLSAGTLTALAALLVSRKPATTYADPF